jgi:hypothetical protein
MRGLPAVLAFAALQLAGLAPAEAAAPAWERWVHVVDGAFDVTGPRSDGRLVVAGSARLALVDPSGAVRPFAAGPAGYHDDPGGEAYMALSPGLRVAAADCEFPRDDLFVLRLHPPLGVTRVTAGGTARPFAEVPGVDSLAGIAFDTVGRFGFRLLVTGSAPGGTTVAAVDCRGRVSVITTSAPVFEGGLAVAPAGFGPFAGALVAADELSGRVYAIDVGGAARTVADSGLPAGPDTGVESVGFLPSGFARGGSVYYADRGPDVLLRLDARQLTGVGLRDGDLLAATEGGAMAVGIRCAATCVVVPVVSAASSAHGEGHLALVARGGAAPALPAAGIAAGLGAVLLVAVALVALLRPRG